MKRFPASAIFLQSAAYSVAMGGSLGTKSIININLNLKQQLEAELTNNRDFKLSKLLTKEMKIAEKQLKEGPFRRDSMSCRQIQPLRSIQER